MPSQELTDPFCRHAKPIDGKQTDYFDTNVKGLVLRVSPAGTRTWNFVYSRPDGRRARLTIGRYPEIPLGGENGVRQRVKDMRSKVGDGDDPIQDRKAKEAARTVADLVADYLRRHAASKRSHDEIARRLNLDVTGVIGAIRLADLHRRDITRCIDAVMDRGSPAAANRLFDDLRALLRWAKARGDLDENIADGMRRPAAKVARDRALSADEIRAVWTALPDADMRESTRRIIRLCLITGQRVGEMTGMTREELDLDNRLWTIPAARSKNGREHKVPLSTMAEDIIREQIAYVDAICARKGRAVPPSIFPAPGGREPVNRAAVSKGVRRQMRNGKILGASPWTPHDLRRTAATQMAEIGISPFVIGHVLNHATVTESTVTTKIYSRYDYGKEKREALEAWADRLAGIVAGGADVVQLRAGK